MRLEQLQYFLEIAECHSINKAGQKLFISQPALSQAINDFEKELGLVLFTRSKKGTFLTPDGERVYRDLKPIITQLFSCYHQWRLPLLAADDLKGTVNILASPLICNIILDEILPLIKKNYPLLNLALHESIAPSELIPTIVSSNINIGANIFYKGNEKDILALAKKHQLHLDIIFQSQYLLYLNSEHPLAHKEHLNSNDLKTLTLAIYSDPKEIVCENFSQYFNQEQIYRLNDIANILRLVRKNQCVTILSEYNHLHFQMDGIVTRQIEDISFPVYYYLAYPASEKLSAAEKIVVSFLHNYFHPANNISLS